MEHRKQRPATDRRSVLGRDSAPWMSALFLAWIFASPATGATIHVPTEQPTIQAGIDAAVDGDIVVVAPGVYTGSGNRDIQFNGKAIELRSSGGRDVTIIDCQGSPEDPHRGFDFYLTGETSASIVDGFTIENGYGVDSAGGIRMAQSRPWVRNCRVRECNSEFGGGGIDGGGGTLENVEFVSCSTNNFWGTAIDCQFLLSDSYGLSLWEGSTLTRCVVAGNRLGLALVANGYGSHVLEECTIVGNGGMGLEVQLTENSVVRSCTIAANQGYEVVFHNWGGLGVAFEQCIIWDFCPGDIDVRIPPNNGFVTFECCDVDPDRIDDQSESGLVVYVGPSIALDPLFCHPAECYAAPTIEGDYYLQPGSPCLAESSPCGEQIGSLGGPCEISGVADPEGGIPRLRLSFPSGVQGGGVLRYRLEGESRAPMDAMIVDLRGRRVASWRLDGGADGELTWELREGGVHLLSGVYFLRVTAGDGANAAGKFVWVDQ